MSRPVEYDYFENVREGDTYCFTTRPDGWALRLAPGSDPVTDAANEGRAVLVVRAPIADSVTENPTGE